MRAWRGSVACVAPGDGSVDQDRFRVARKKARSWKAAGPDGICAFWWKVFPKAAEKLCRGLEEVTEVASPIFPPWFVRGRTVLIPKEGCRGKVDQYRPITCLNTAYKMFTTVLTNILYDHVEENHLLPAEQCALRRGRRGCLDALLVDNMVLQMSIRKAKNLSVVWIDYKKAYDRVPHGWLELVLEAISAPAIVRRSIARLIPMWESKFTMRTDDGPVQTNLTFKRGLFQGDSLSPLLFCLCIAPISQALRSTAAGYRSKRGSVPATHQFYMDDLKLYAQTRKDLADKLGIVDRVTTAVGMELGLRKCAVAHMEKGKVVQCEDFLLPEDRTIAAVSGGETYRYLGIEQVFKSDHEGTRRKLTKAYVKRLRRIWSSDLNAKHKASATVGWAVSMFRYFFNHVLWTKGALVALDRKTRSVIRQYKGHHLPAALERLYLPRRQGGRGLMSLQWSWEREVVSTVMYLYRAEHLQEVVEQQQWLVDNNNRHCLLKCAKSVLNKYDLAELLDEAAMGGGDKRSFLKKCSVMIKDAQLEEAQESLRSKLIHGVYFKQCEKSEDTSGCHIWLSDGRFQSKTEALVVAAQDGVILTRAYRARVLKEPIPQACRVCKKAPETIGHILSACDPLHWTLHKERHDRVVYRLMLALAAKYQLAVPQGLRWGPDGWNGVAVLEGPDAKLSVDLSIPTDKQLTARRPDLVAYLCKEKVIVIFEVACAWEPLVNERELEKFSKYRDLAADLASQNPGWRVKTVPLVVGTLGTVNSFRRGSLS